MKRFTAFALVLVLALSVLVGCGNTQKEETTTETTTQETTAAQEATEATTEATTLR